LEIREEKVVHDDQAGRGVQKIQQVQVQELDDEQEPEGGWVCVRAPLTSRPPRIPMRYRMVGGDFKDSNIIEEKEKSF
jgi:hypothetical protein